MLLLLVLLGTTFCGGPFPNPLAASQSAVTNGRDDDGDPAVVALLRGGKAYCSGTVIAPRVVLTAAHCLSPVPPEAVFFGAHPINDGAILDVIAALKHPDYVSPVLGKDVGLVLLAAPAAPPPIPLFRAVFDVSFIGHKARLIGFGHTSAADNGLPRKRDGGATIARIEEGRFAVEPAPSLPCSGDSGGPVLLTIDGSEVLAGVVSEGDPGCVAQARATRIDVYLAAFIQSYLDAATESVATVGQRCFYAANCMSGVCYAPPDAHGFNYCSATCSGDRDCPIGMACASDDDGKACRHPFPSPGALGAPCENHADCAFGMCGRPTSDAPRVCSALCFPGVSNTCQESYFCGHNLDTENAYGCFAEPTGGCNIGNSRVPPGVLAPIALLLLLLLLFVRRISTPRDLLVAATEDTDS